MTGRQDWILGSKVGERFSQGESHFDFSADGARESVERSLTCLKTDYLDYCLLHSDGDDEAVLASGALETLDKLKSEGRVRAIGISSKTVTGGLKSWELGLDLVRLTLNLAEQTELTVAQQAADRGVLVKKALGGGHLDPEASLLDLWPNKLTSPPLYCER